MHTCKWKQLSLISNVLSSRPQDLCEHGWQHHRALQQPLGLPHRDFRSHGQPLPGHAYGVIKDIITMCAPAGSFSLPLRSKAQATESQILQCQRRRHGNKRTYLHVLTFSVSTHTNTCGVNTIYLFFTFWKKYLIYNYFITWSIVINKVKCL